MCNISLRIANAVRVLQCGAFKSDRDATRAEHHALLAKTLELQNLLKHLVEDTIFLQRANDQCKRELGMRRKFDDSGTP